MDKLCKICKGKCCKRSAGVYLPTELTITKEAILNLLQKGKHAIDKDDSTATIYFIRPRHVNKDSIDFSWEGTCIHLTDTGCSLPQEQKPYQCRTLVPDVIGCYYPDDSNGTFYEMVKIWSSKQYQKILKEVLKICKV
jgi:Fe-S-cluster containining protein